MVIALVVVVLIVAEPSVESTVTGMLGPKSWSKAELHVNTVALLVSTWHGVEPIHT